MTEPLAAVQAAQAAALRAAASLSAAQIPALRAALEAMDTPAVGALKAALSAARAGLVDPVAVQALTNVEMILVSARATVVAKLAEAGQVIAQAPTGDA